MSNPPSKELIDQLTWSLITSHAGESCEVVQGDPQSLFGINAKDFALGLAGRVAGDAPSPCPWLEPCESSLYLLKDSNGEAHWVESRSTKGDDGSILVSTQLSGPAQSQKALTRLGRITLGGSLLGPLAHEVNNFVQGLFAATYFFKDCVEQGDPIDPEFVEDLSQVVTDLAQIGSSIQEFSRQQLSPAEPIELVKVINQAATFLRSAGKLKTVELSIDTSAMVSRLHWPRAEIDFIVVAVLCNAAEAAGRNKEEQSVRVVAADSDAGVTLDFYDSGGGFALAESSQPFTSDGPEHRNLGLGLSIVSAIVATHGGTISASKEKKDSLVRLILPRAIGA